jgi:uncharacterized protein YjiS (DUF1127 family)
VRNDVYANLPRGNEHEETVTMTELPTTLPRRCTTIVTQRNRVLQRATLRALELFDTWSARRYQRRALLELDERLLRDIGVTRGEAYEEGMKPFWRD